MKKSTLFGWCVLALLAGIGYVSLKHPAPMEVLLFLGLPFVLGGCVWRFGGN
jgi:hypothetical protein